MVRIGIIGDTSPDTFADNVAHTFTQMGHEVSRLGSLNPRKPSRTLRRVEDIAREAFPALEARLHRRVAMNAMDPRCDVVITTDGRLAPDAVSALRAAKIPVALWFPDAVSSLGRQRMLAAPYTALFFKDSLLVQRLRDTLGLPVWHLPEACNPTWHRPIGEPGSDRHIVVVGNTYLTRLILLGRLYEEGIPLRIYGSPFPRWAPKLLPPDVHMGRSVHRQEKSRVFRQAAAVMNNLHPAEMTGVNARLFEATGAGAAVLCERRPELENLFDIQNEVVPFTDFSELVDRVKALLDDPALTRKVGDAATIRAHADHTYTIRLNIMLERLV